MPKMIPSSHKNNQGLEKQPLILQCTTEAHQVNSIEFKKEKSSRKGTSSIERVEHDFEKGLGCDSDTKQPRTGPRRCCLRLLLITIIILMLVVLIILALIFIGAIIENSRMNKVKSTVDLYSNDTKVCAFDKSDSILTFNSAIDAHSANMTIAHCGSCGHCSNHHDIEIYAQTRDTLTTDSFLCALLSFFGRRNVSKCFHKRVGFTTQCQDCWTSNVFCTKKHCKWSCLKYRLMGESNNKNGESLNDCLECDERMCGPQFLECAGANRRQSGIVSDIGRDGDKEQCHEVDYDWVKLAK